MAARQTIRRSTTAQERGASVMGFIRERRGKHQVRYRDPSGRERSKSFDRITDARRFLQDVEVDKRRGDWLDPRRAAVRFETFATSWVEGRASLRPASRARDESLLRVHLLPKFGPAPIGRIAHADVQAWVNALSSKGLSPRTVRECFRLLSSVMKAATTARMIRESPCTGIELPRVERVEQRFLSAEEVDRLVEAAPPMHRALILSAVYLGCRWEELAGLKRKHLDLLHKRLRIIGTIERVAGTYRYVDETKTSTSRRTVTIPPFLVEIMAAHLADAPASEFVFPARAGAFIRYDNFRTRVWNPTARRAGLEGLTFHELRHTAAALMIDAGANPLEVRDRLGHRDIRTTLNVYGHRFPASDDRIADALESTYQTARANRDADQMRTAGTLSALKTASEQGKRG